MQLLVLLSSALHSLDQPLLLVPQLVQAAVVTRNSLHLISKHLGGEAPVQTHRRSRLQNVETRVQNHLPKILPCGEAQAQTRLPSRHLTGERNRLLSKGMLQSHQTAEVTPRRHVAAKHSDLRQAGGDLRNHRRPSDLRQSGAGSGDDTTSINLSKKVSAASGGLGAPLPLTCFRSGVVLELALERSLSAFSSVFY